MRHLRNVGLAVLLLATGASVSVAQRSVNTGGGANAGGYWEFGVDFAALVFGMDNPSTTSLGFGAGDVRAAKYISDVMAVEPRIGFGYFSTSGSSSNSLGIEVGLLYHLQSDRKMNQWYARPLLIFNRSSFTSGGTTNSTNRMGIGAGFGIKMPSKKNSRFTWRYEATYTNMMKSGTIPSSSSLSINGGVSVFTK
jgi:hypothetical protein